MEISKASKIYFFGALHKIELSRYNDFLNFKTAFPSVDSNLILLLNNLCYKTSEANPAI